MIREITHEDKERIIDYLRLTRKVSHGGKTELLENVPTEEKLALKKLFDHFRTHGIFAYLSRADEIIFRGIKNWDASYNWEEGSYPEPTEAEKIVAKEWLRNINILLSKRRARGEGERMAEEIIAYMKNNFMGVGNVPRKSSTGLQDGGHA